MMWENFPALQQKPAQLSDSHPGLVFELSTTLEHLAFYSRMTCQVGWLSRLKSVISELNQPMTAGLRGNGANPLSLDLIGLKEQGVSACERC